MARVLIVVPPLTGHVNPTIALGAELERRGHAVAWCGVSDVARLLPSRTTFLPVGGEMGGTVHEVAERGHGLRGAGALKFLWEEVLVPLARHMRPGLEEVVDAWEPDVLVTDQQALAGAVVGLRRGLRWITSATTSAQLVQPLDALPLVRAWLDEQLLALQVEAGIDAEVAAANDLSASPHLVLAYTTEALVGPGPFAGSVRFVGPAIADREEDLSSFPWERLAGDRPSVLVSLGTVNAEAGARFWGVASEAFSSLEATGVFVAPPDLVPDPPPNVLVCGRVPQLALLERVDAVVSHGGHNTVCESLAAGRPLVLAPIRDDQPIVADQVVRAGAGVRVKFGRVRPDGLRAAVTQALDDPALRAAAARVQESFAASGGTPYAASLVEATLVP